MQPVLVSSEEMRAAERAAMDRGVPEEALMERAGLGVASALAGLFPRGARLIVFAGKGHNAGDALVAARALAFREGQQGGSWEVEVRLAFQEEDLRPLALKKLRELGQAARIAPLDAPASTQGSSFHSGQPPALVLLDGILGLGSSLPLRGPALAAARSINHLRREAFAVTVAVDLPTGINGSTGEADENAVIADHTVTLGFPKSGLVADTATACVGRLHCVPLPELNPPTPGRDFLITSGVARGFLPSKRPFSMHKGEAGRVGIVAGSIGCVGAARLCSAAAIAAGAGLVTLFVPSDIYGIAASSCMPEVMVRPLAEMGDFQMDAWGAGPGIGSKWNEELMLRLVHDPHPVVFDADALNQIAAQDVGLLNDSGGLRLLTPHPGEMTRLQTPAASESRAAQARRFTDTFPVTLLLKGSRTVIAERGQPLAFNTTGTPAMATGGMGDVLTGICAAFLAQGIAAMAAGCAASWLLGRAAEIAEIPAAPESLSPTQVIQALPFALADARRGAWS